MSRLPDGSGAPPAELTFLIADVRGYTRFTRERGDAGGFPFPIRASNRGNRSRGAPADDAGQVWVVPATLQEQEAAACAVANRNFTRAEWQEFVPGTPYRQICPNAAG